MIVPWLKGFLSWRKAPITWAIILMNIFIFAATVEPESNSSAAQFATVEMMTLTGHLYDQYKNPATDDAVVRDVNEWIVLGSEGLKDPVFVKKAPTLKFHGDDLAIAAWKNKISQYDEVMTERNSRIFGLRTQNSTALSWVTYQFMHANAFHLFGNMMMMLIFGAALEQLAGGLGLILIYLVGGVFAAWSFLALSPSTVAPMIGASGSLSAVMAFYAAYEHRRRVSFFYFVSPMNGYWGWIYLPTLIIFPLCFLPDIVGYLSNPVEFGDGIAYAAHMGGALFGFLLGFGCRFLRHSRSGVTSIHSN
jgi:membrane associated rhomboid family serine protease